MRALTLMLMTFMLAGCASQAQIVARQEAQREAVNRADDAQCESYGAKPGTDAYIGCRMNIQNQRTQLAAAATVAAPAGQANNIATMNASVRMMRGY